MHKLPDKKLIPISGSDTKLLLEIGFLLAKCSLYEESEKVFNGILAIDPSSTPALLGLSNIFLVTQQTEKSETILKKLLNSTKNQAEINVFLGELMLIKGSVSESTRFLHKAIAIDRTGPSGQMARLMLKLIDYLDGDRGKGGHDGFDQY